MSKNSEKNGTISVVLCERMAGEVDPNKKVEMTTYGGIGAGGGEYLGRSIVRHVVRGVKKAARPREIDRFFGEGDFAPKPS